MTLVILIKSLLAMVNKDGLISVRIGCKVDNRCLCYNNNLHWRMSFLISGIDSFILGKPPLRTRAGEVLKGVTNFSLLGKEEVQKSLEKTAGCLNDESIEIECSDDNVTINFLFLKVYRNMSFVLRAVINRHSRQLHLTYKLLNAQQSYMVVNSG